MTVVKRKVDKVARFGGEEIIAVLPETDEEGAAALTESLIDAVRKAAIEHTGSGSGQTLTISLGVCTVIPSRDCKPVDFIYCVDEALYEAKDRGRDCFVVKTPR